jgi:ABC-type Fe3+-hydroxamate transport system substrate-binding protein
MNIKLIKILIMVSSLMLGTAHAAETECPTIVSQSPYITKTLQWLGLEDCIVGVSRYDKLDRPHTGGVMDPDGNMLSLLEPQLWFTSDWTPAQTQEQITPEETHTIQLQGFASMTEIEENLRTIGLAVGMTDIEQRVQRFHTTWIEGSAAIGGGGRTALLVSACSGAPYSFGKERWIADLFQHAGFDIVETEKKIRHIRSGEKIETLTELVEQLKPQLLFSFERPESNGQCAYIHPRTGIKIVHLNSEQFLDPSPTILEGLAALDKQKDQWKTP